MENNTGRIPEKREKEFGIGTFIFLIILIGAIAYMASVMGIGPMFKTFAEYSVQCSD